MEVKVINEYTNKGIIHYYGDNKSKLKECNYGNENF